MLQAFKVSALLLVLAWSARLSAADDLSDQARTLLAEKCLSCHGAAKMSGLDLRTREGSLAGGGRGPAISPGKSAESLLLQAVQGSIDLKMPPGKGSLSDDQVRLLARWIDAGAAWTETPSDEPTWWSFKAPVRPTPPSTKYDSRVRNPIDAFVFAKLEEKGLQPESEADRRTLIRRLYFDLHGLPPPPEAVDAFLADTRADAYERLVDDLLASPRYGERWGRHWLDVARYADTAGFETDAYFLNAWRYRDYVIDSFNADKPYDEFVREQIAADEIWPDNLDLDGSYVLPESKKRNLQRRIGTSLYTIGAFPVEITFHGDQYRAEWQAEAVEVTASAFLGVTLGCARCHDHKFDPFPQRDYYRMSALFSGSEEREIPIVSRMEIYEFTRHQSRWKIVEETEDEIRRLDREAKEKGRTPADRDRRETLLRKLGEAYLKAPEPVDTASLLVHTDRVPDTYVLNRGDWQNKGDRVSPGFPAALNPGPPIDEPQNALFVPQRRKALAEWLTAPDQPLLARVMVNRIWQGHFGRGIVATPNDFGHQGSPPTHPQLLDWLAVEFAERDYSVKAMHRLIVSSDAYRRSSSPNEANAAKDSENIYLWRMNRQRLEAESLRDAVLSVAGTLNLKAGGPPVTPPLTEEEMDGMRDRTQWPVTSDEREHTRRSVYLFVKRSFRLPMFETFNAPDAILSCERRDKSTIAPQALTLMNGKFVNDQAAAFAERLRREGGESTDAQVRLAWRLALAREPEAAELERAKALAAEQGLDRLALLVLNLSEFVYVD